MVIINNKICKKENSVSPSTDGIVSAIGIEEIQI